MFFLKKIRLILFILILSTQMWAALTITHNGAGSGGSSGNRIGQSFTATHTGVITSIGVASDGSLTDTLKIYSGSGIGGTLLHTQIVTFSDTTTSTSSYTFFTITLDATVNITSGNTYTFAFSDGQEQLVYGGNDYANGDLYVGTSAQSGLDLRFEIVQGDAAALDPIITSTTYDASIGSLVVTGTNFEAKSGASNDVTANKFTFTGEGGSTYTLTDTTDVEITSSTEFTLNLSATDKSAVNQITNKNGTSSTSGTTYNISAADDYIANVTSGDTSDTTNAITVSNVPTPTITSATYDASTGSLVIIGTNFVKKSGATNEIDSTKLTLVGQSGNSYTLTSSSVEITNSTSASITLNATDKLTVNGLLNKDGTISVSGTTYNLSGAEDWMAGYSGTDVDSTSNGVTVSNVSSPTITSSSYDATTGY